MQGTMFTASPTAPRYPLQRGEVAYVDGDAFCVPWDDDDGVVVCQSATSVWVRAQWGIVYEVRPFEEYEEVEDEDEDEGEDTRVNRPAPDDVVLKRMSQALFTIGQALDLLSVHLQVQADAIRLRWLHGFLGLALGLVLAQLL